MRVLITGATGLIGSEVTRWCREKEIEVNYLTTSKSKIEKESGYKGFYWSPSRGDIDPEAFEGVSTILHLAGENIAQRWNHKQKEKIVSSRVQSAELLFQELQDNNHSVTHFITASGIGIYPSSLEKLYNEENKGVDDSFVGEVVVEWEGAANRFSQLGIDVARVRIGLVLAADGGLLEKLKEPIGYYVGAPLGNGRQWQSWIHIEDLARIFVHIMENNLEGVYNAVAPNPVTNQELVQELAAKMHKPLWLPKVPAIAIELALGEMSRLVLSSQLVSSRKIEQTGFDFHYKNLSKALEDLVA